MKLASIERITKIEKHPNADTLSIVSCVGYEAIVKTGSFSEGDLCIFVQPDSCLPNTAEFEEYRKYVKTRVKACKIRNFWSMGLILPVSFLENYGDLSRSD